MVFEGGNDITLCIIVVEKELACFKIFLKPQFKYNQKGFQRYNWFVKSFEIISKFFKII